LEIDEWTFEGGDMGYPQDGASKYKQTSVESASKEKILLMLYEGAIKNIKLAKKALEEKRIADKGTYLGKAHAIVSELMSSLDHNIGGQLTKDLESLYIYILQEMTRGNLENDATYFDRIIKLLETLYDGWTKAVETVRKDKAIAKGKSVKA
jgi:flagellar protein FliS